LNAIPTATAAIIPAWKSFMRMQKKPTSQRMLSAVARGRAVALRFAVALAAVSIGVLCGGCESGNYNRPVESLPLPLRPVKVARPVLSSNAVASAAAGAPEALDTLRWNNAPGATISDLWATTNGRDWRHVVRLTKAESWKLEKKHPAEFYRVSHPNIPGHLWGWEGRWNSSY
jgi:hypothetical protein